MNRKPNAIAAKIVGSHHAISSRSANAAADGTGTIFQQTARSDARAQRNLAGHRTTELFRRRSGNL